MPLFDRGREKSDRKSDGDKKIHGVPFHPPKSSRFFLVICSKELLTIIDHEHISNVFFSVRV